MNVKMISKALHTLSLLSEEDYDLVLKLRALTEDEREQFRTALELQKPAAKKASKRSSKSSQSSTKSSRASGMAAQLKERREQGRGSASSSHCYATVDDNGGEMTCGKLEDDPVHDTTYLSSHPFVPAVPTAPARSPANGGAGNSTANSGTVTDDAGVVAHGASGGD